MHDDGKAAGERDTSLPEAATSGGLLRPAFWSVFRATVNDG